MNLFLKKHDRKSSTQWKRLICAICAIVLILLPCSGCAHHVTTDELDVLKNDMANELEQLKGAHDDARAEIDTLKEQNENAHQKIEALLEDNAAAQQKIEALLKDNAAAQQKIEALQKTNEEMQNEIGGLQDSKNAAQEEIDALKESQDAAQEEIAALRESLNAKQEEIDALRESDAATQEALNALQESYAAALQEIELLKQQLEDLKNEPTEPKIRIYIDQGHNPSSYHNTGAVGNGLFEQDLTFTIGCLLAKLFEEDGRFEIRLSRPTASTVLGTDNESSLEARVLGAQEFGADYFISLHTNAYESESANGIEVFVAEQDSTSYAFGSSLLQGMILSTNLRDRGMKLNPDLYVLKNATMPAALLEMGFITNVADATLLSESPELFAQGIYNGVLSYFNLSPQE